MLSRKEWFERIGVEPIVGVAVSTLLQHKKYKTHRNAGVANSFVAQTQPRLHSDSFIGGFYHSIPVFVATSHVFINRTSYYMKRHRLSQG